MTWTSPGRLRATGVGQIQPRDHAFPLFGGPSNLREPQAHMRTALRPPPGASHSLTGETRLRGIAWPRSAGTPSWVVWSLCPGGVQPLARHRGIVR
jgi:hypothetical protein